MKLSRLIAGAVALLGVSTVAYAAGMFTNLPIVGGAAYCALYAGDGTTCSGSVPAGPTALTGSELIPADTGVAGGSSPQTVYIDVSTLGAGPTQYSTPLTGVTQAVAAGTRQVILEPAGTIAAHTLTLAAASLLTEGQRLGVCSTQVVTALTITPGSGTTVSNTLTATQVPLGTGGAFCAEWVYVKSVTKWLRTQ
jgi:hypothetical protein